MSREGSGEGGESAAAEAAPSPAFAKRKKQRQSLGRRVSFAAPAVLETVREFEPEGDEDKSGETYEANAEVPAGFSIVEEASVETAPARDRTETFEFKASAETVNVAGGTTPSPAEDADAADFSLSPVANDEQEAPNSAQLNSEGKHTPGKRRASVGRFGTPNSADRTGTFTFNASQNMDDVTSEVPTMGALLDAADTENITGAVPSLSNLLNADESPLGYRQTPTRANPDATEDITGTVPSLAALANEDEEQTTTSQGEMDMDTGNTTDGIPAFEPTDDLTQRAVDAAHASALDLANTVMMDDATVAFSMGAPTPGSVAPGPTPSLTFAFDEKSGKRESAGLPPRSVTANTRPFNLTDSTNLDLQGQAKGGMGTNTFNYVYGANGDGTATAGTSAPANPPTAEVTGTDVQAVMGVTPANGAGVAATPNTDGSIASSHDGFTPGDESLRMAELLRQKQHGDEALMSMRKVYQERTTPMQGRYGAPPVMQAFTPSRTITMGGANFMQFGAAGTPGAAMHNPLFGTPGGNTGTMLQGLPTSLPPIPDALMNSKPIDLETFFYACEISFMEAKNLGRRSSIAMGALATAPPPETQSEALKLCCLTAPLIEALEGFHEQLNVRMNALTTETEKLRSTVEATQPPLLRYAASDDPAHANELRRAGKALKKECQLAAKERFAQQRMETEELVRESLNFHSEILLKSSQSIANSRAIASEAISSANGHIIKLRAQRAASSKRFDAAKSTSATKEQVLEALANKRAAINAARRALVASEENLERMNSRKLTIKSERDRLQVELDAMREAQDAAADATVSFKSFGGVDMDDTPSRLRRASQVRLRAKAKNAQGASEELGVLSGLAPWRLEGVGGPQGAELTIRVGSLFRVTLDASTGAGRVMSVDGPEMTPKGGREFAAALAGAPIAWGEDAVPAGGVAGVLQELAPKLSRAERVLEEMEACRNEFPRLNRIKCSSTGVLELTFVDFVNERLFSAKLNMMGGAYPYGALSPEVVVQLTGKKGVSELPNVEAIQRAINSVPVGSRRLTKVCRILDSIVSTGKNALTSFAAMPAPAPRRPSHAPSLLYAR